MNADNAQHRRGQVSNPGSIQVWPPTKVHIALDAQLRAHVAAKAGLEGADRLDPRLLGAAVRNLFAQDLARSEALQRAKQQVNESLK